MYLSYNQCFYIITYGKSLIPQPNIFAEECVTSQADMNLYCGLENNQNEG